MNLNAQFEQFIRERIYIRDVTPKTRDWYQSAWQAFKASRLERGQILRSPGRIYAVRYPPAGAGVKPVSCNIWLRAINAFCRWLHDEDFASKVERLLPQRLPKHLRPVHDIRVLR